MSSDPQLQEIKDRLDVIEVLSSYLKLSKAGRNFKALCPFHHEKTPSFVVSSERQFWHCFGCGESGDIFTFVMKMEGMEFPEVLRFLAEKAGVELKRVNYEATGAKVKILEINRVAKNFYKEQLEKTQEGLAAKKYLLGRGLTEESIGNFEIGYAPDAWRETENFLLARGFSRKEIFSSGLTIQKDRGTNFSAGKSGENFYDRFRGRIMFPILDIAGRAVGFGGRAFAKKDGTEAKYINSPESQTYSKSRILYGLNFARESVRKENSCILVEGYMDVIGSHQMGVQNAVSTSGTALTAEQLKLVKRYTPNLILSFDGDAAGQEATRRSIDLAMAAGFNTKVIILPEKKDPSDFVDNPGHWKKYIRDAVPVIDFYFKNAFSKNNPKDIEGKKSIARELLEAIAKFPSNIEQAHWVGVLGEKLEIDAKILMEELKIVKAGKKNAGRIDIAREESSYLVKNPEGLESYLLSLLVLLPRAPEHIKKIKECGFVFTNSNFQKIYGVIAGFDKECLRSGNLMVELKKTLAPDLFRVLAEITLKAEYYYEIESEEEKQEKFFDELLKRLAVKQCETRQKTLEQDIKIAEKNKDRESVDLFIKELNEILQKKEKLTN